MIALRYLAALVEEGEPGFLFEDRLEELLEGDTPKAIFVFVRDYYQRYGKLPSLRLISEEIGFDLAEWVTDASPAFYLDKMRRQKAYRMLQEGAKRASSLLEESEDHLNDASSILETALSDQRALESSRDGPTDFTSEECHEARLEIFLKREQGEGPRGIPSPWSTLDDWTMGLQPGDLVSVLGTTSVGKTWFLLLLAHAALRAERKVLFGSLEMGREPLEIRIDAIRNKLSHRGLRRAELDNFQRERYLRYLKEKDDSPVPFIIAEPKHIATISALEGAIERADPEIVFIDSFYKMTISNAPHTIWERVAKIVWELKMLAVRRAIPIVISGQFNKQVRQTTRGRRVGQVQDASFSFALSQDSDTVIALDQTPHWEEARVMQIRTLKMRNDEGGDFFVHWDLDAMIFDELSPAEVEELLNEGG